MADFNIEIQNLPALQKAMRNFSGIASPILQKALQAAEFVFQKNTLKGNPIPWRTGNLLQSFRFGISPFRASWGPTAYYAPFVEFGTRPHIIRPVRAKVLAWRSGGGASYVTSKSGKQYYKKTEGGTTFASLVHHPGTKPSRFMEKLVDKSASEISRLFVQAGDMITAEIARQTA